MKFLHYSFLFIMIAFLSSCEFKCNVGEVKEEKETSQTKGPVMQDGTAIYNGIHLQKTNVKISRAYLIFKNGSRVPQDNFVDFKDPVKLIIEIDSGWVEHEGLTHLGMSEKIVRDNGDVLADEKDLLAWQYDKGASSKDAKTLSFTATIQAPKDAPPTSFIISFSAWDKKGEGKIEGYYKLYSK